MIALRIARVVLGAAALTISLLMPYSPQASAQAPIDPSPFDPLMPQLRTAPAPAWLKPGTRLTFYAAAATVVGGRHYYYQDENGNWVDPETGKRFSQGDVPSASGHGLVQLTVVHLDQSAAVIDARSYSYADVRGPLVLAALTSFVTPPGAAGDYWVDPQALARLVGTRAQGFTIARLPYPLNGRQFRAVRIQFTSASGYQAWVYDEDSGLLLRGSTSTQGAPIQGPVGQGDTRSGGTLLTQSTIVEVRQLNLPWMFGPMPNWVAQTHLVRFEGKTTAQLGASMPAATIFERIYVGQNWARYAQRMTSGGAEGAITRVFGPAQAGGLWISPAVMGQLQQGQTVDNDRAAGVVTSIGQIGRAQGTDFVQVIEDGSGWRGDYVYDRRDGALIFSGFTNKFLKTQTELRVVQRQ